MKKLLVVLLTVAMLLTLPIGVFGISAAEDNTVEAYTEALKAENGNLAVGKDVYVNYSAHTHMFGRTVITDGSLNDNFGETGSGSCWHSGDSSGHNRPTWFAIDFGEKVKLDTVVLYSRTNNGLFEGHANAIRIIATDETTITDINLVAADKREEWAEGDTWIGEGCKNPDWIPYNPPGTVVYEQFDMDLRDKEAVPLTFQFEAVETQYLVVYALSLFGPWRGWNVAECAAYYKGYTPVAGPTNLAEGKEVTSSASHEDGPWTASKLTDGDRYNMNESLQYTNDYGQYTGFHSNAGLPHDGSTDVTVDINLGAKTAFDTLTIWPSTAKYASNESTEMFVPANYDIQISNNGGETWDTIKSVTNTEITEYAPITHSFETLQEATLVRLLFKGITKHIKLSEVEIFNLANETPETPEEPSKLACGDDIFGAMYQTRTLEGDKHDMRIVLVANVEKLAEIATTATVKVTFVLESGAEVYIEGTLGGAKSDYGLFQTITADGDVYEAAEGYALFGNVVTGIPNGAYTSVSVTITDNTTSTTLLTAASN